MTYIRQALRYNITFLKNVLRRQHYFYKQCNEKCKNNYSARMKYLDLIVITF